MYMYVAVFSLSLSLSLSSSLPFNSHFSPFPIAIPAGGAGVIVGALIIYFTKSKGRRVALITWIISALTILPVLVFLVRCPTLNLSGVTVPYSDG